VALWTCCLERFIRLSPHIYEQVFVPFSPAPPGGGQQNYGSAAGFSCICDVC
ncbi:hypothetical protein NFI96_021060, partial [Prochilodus magdalenae]